MSVQRLIRSAAFTVYLIILVARVQGSDINKIKEGFIHSLSRIQCGAKAASVVLCSD